MELAQFCSTSRVIIVAGKGGVGKTTVTATLATAAARTGMSVLIVEVEGKSGLVGRLRPPDLGYEESELAPGSGRRTLTPDAALVDWLETQRAQADLEAAGRRPARSTSSPPRSRA